MSFLDKLIVFFVADLDYVCPFSAKMFHTVYSSVLPILEKTYPSKVQFIFRQQIQPWHPSSTLCHESAAAVLQIAPEKFWPFSEALFQKQTEFFDVNVVNEPRNGTYRRLSKVAGSVGLDEGKLYSMLEVSDKPGDDGALNVGNSVTNDIKILVKAARRSGVHVSPTVLFNGIEEGGLGSSTNGQQWEDWLKKNVT